MKKNNLERNIRQERHQLVDDKLELSMDSGSLEILDYSATGMAVLAQGSHGIDLDGEIFGKILCDNIELGLVHLRYVRSEEMHSPMMKICFDCQSCLIPVDEINAFLETKKVMQQHFQKIENYGEIPEKFRLTVLELRSTFSSLENELENLNKSEINKGMDKIVYQNSIIKFASMYIEKFFTRMYKEFVHISETSSKEQIKAYLMFFREELSSIYMSPAANRFYSKPLGYAGDYEMMNMIYRDQLEGTSIFAKVIHHYCVNHPNAKAVRNRVGYLREKINQCMKENKRKVRILSVASGPAEEVQRLVDEMDVDSINNVEIYLLDQDLISLKFAQLKIKERMYKNGVRLDIKYVNMDIKNVIARGLTENNFDLIYSAGLFDYFSDPIAQLAAGQLYKSLAKGGKLVIGNFDINLEYKAFMDSLFDWNLKYRSGEDLVLLYGHLCDSISVESEPEKVNKFAILRRNE